MKKAKELRDLSLEELELTYDQSRKELFELKSVARSARREQQHLLPQKRKEIARVLTLLHEKKRGT